MITLETLQQWLNAPAENEQLEFKEAKHQFDTTKLLKYCVALANEGGGFLVLGITDKLPRQIVGSQAFLTPAHLNDIKARIVQKLRFRVETTELNHPDGRVLVFNIPPRPTGQPLAYDGTYLMRAGEELVPMSSKAFLLRTNKTGSLNPPSPKPVPMMLLPFSTPKPTLNS